MERKDFINKDPVTGEIVNFLHNNMKKSYTAEELTHITSGPISEKQVQKVMSLLMQQGMVTVTSKNGIMAYQLKS